MITTANYMIKAVVNGENYVFQYENCGDAWEALELFWHQDFGETLADVHNNGEFPIDVIALDNGKAIRKYTFTFNMAVFDHFFDKGWSASSGEAGERYTLTQFGKDIERRENKENDVTSFFFYMWNAWCKEECQKAFAGCDYNHFWSKWCHFCESDGVRGATECLYAELDNSNRDKLVARATELYDGMDKKD